MLKNMKITRQVMAGFGLILLMLALFAAFTWNQLNSLRSIQQATQSSSVLAMRVMDVNQAVTETRLAFDRFIASGRPQDSEALLAEMHEVRAIAIEIEQQGVPDADRLVAVKDRHIQEVGDFASNFTKQAERVAQSRELGAGMRADFDGVQQLLASRANQDQSLAVMRAAGAFSLARIRTEEFLTARGQETYDNAEASFEELKTNMSSLNPSLLPADAGALLTKIRGEIDQYRQIITAIQQEEPDLRAAMEKVVATTAETVALTAEIRNAAVARKEALDAQATTISRATISSVLIGVAVAILLGTFVAWLLTHALSKGLSRTVDQTRRLATGDLDLEITGIDGRNELAELARALSIFKDNALERLRLAAEARRMTEASADARETEMKEQARVVRDIGDGLNRLAGGDLTAQIPSPASDPFPAGYETLREAFNSVLATFSGTMSRIGDVSDQVRGGSDEITSAAHDLSSRAETQAATLEQSAAALNEMSESVRSTAERARQAEQASQQNREIAETSSAIVRDAVEAMKGIEKSSDQITRIIGVIDDIAFQTNLLALNAGVEAARAGEAGRGFAVVASEVRGLAQRASDSAREIKVLISDSAAQVKAGSSLVGRTGESLDLILGRAREVSEQVSAIARAANEQAIGLSEINAGVNQLDQVTQQNAAVAEQTNAAAVSLQQRAEDLMREISAFRVEGKARAPMVRPQRARSNTANHAQTGLRVVAGRGDVAGQLYEF